MARIRLKVITEPREKRRYDGSLTYSCVAVDEKSRIAYISFDQSFHRQVVLESFLTIVNCESLTSTRQLTAALEKCVRRASPCLVRCYGDVSNLNMRS